MFGCWLNKNLAYLSMTGNQHYRSHSYLNYFFFFRINVHYCQVYSRHKVTRFTKKCSFHSQRAPVKKQSLLKNVLNPYNYILYTIYRRETAKFYSAHFKVLYLN
jgi:hypothetical protein